MAETALPVAPAAPQDYRTIVFINCGATRDVRDLVDCRPQTVRFVIIDAHRPVHYAYNTAEDTKDVYVVLADDDPVPAGEIPVYDEELEAEISGAHVAALTPAPRASTTSCNACSPCLRRSLSAAAKTHNQTAYTQFQAASSDAALQWRGGNWQQQQRPQGPLLSAPKGIISLALPFT